MFQDKAEHFGERGGGQRDATVSRAVVDPQFIRLWPVNHSARKHHSRYVSHEFVVLPRTEDPFRAASPDLCRLLKIKKRQAGAVERTGGGLAYAVIDQEPAFWGFDRRRPDPDPGRVPPASGPGCQHRLRRCPAMQVAGAREPDVGPVRSGP